MQTLSLHPLVASDRMLEFEPCPGSIVVCRADAPTTLASTLRARGADDVELLIADNTISKEHASLGFADDAWFVENRAPLNGTYLDLIPLADGERSPLGHGGLIEFGSAAFLVQIGDLQRIEPHAFAAPTAETIAPATSTMPLATDVTRLAVFARIDSDDTIVRDRASDSLCDRCLQLSALYQRSLRTRYRVDHGTYEDATQEAIIRVLRHLRKRGAAGYRPEAGRFRAFYRVVVANALKSLLRGSRPIPVDLDTLVVTADDRAMIRCMIEDEIRAALALVKEEASAAHWQVYEHRIINGLSSKETASSTGRTENGVDRIVSDLRRKLRAAAVADAP